MLIKQVCQKSVIFVTIGIFYIIFLSFNQMSAIYVINLLIMSMNLSNIAISNIKDSEYCCIIAGIS